MKLRHGSQRDLNSPSKEAGEVETEESETTQMDEDSTTSATISQEGPEVVSSSPHEEVIAIDTDYSSQRTQPSSVDCLSMGSSRQRRKPTVSVLYLFSKFRGSQDVVSSSPEDADVIEKVFSVSDSSSLSSCLSQSAKEQFEEELVDSLPVSPM